MLKHLKVSQSLFEERTPQNLLDFYKNIVKKVEKMFVLYTK